VEDFSAKEKDSAPYGGKEKFILLSFLLSRKKGPSAAASAVCFSG